MKVTLIYIAAAALLPDTTLAIHLSAFLAQPQPQQPPKCSLYTGFKDSPSFTSFCKQLSPATWAHSANVQAPASTSAQKIPSILTEHFTFDGGRTSTVSPVEPVISSAAASNTYVMQNYTITTSGLSSSGNIAASSITSSNTDFEVHCYLSGSKLPMSECTRTAGLTRHHGYTYTHTRDTTSSMQTTYSQPSKGGAASSAKATSSTAVCSSKSASSSKPSSSAVVPPASISTTSTPSFGSATVGSGKLTSTNCTNTTNLTRHNGYTFSDTLTPVRSTANLTPSSIASSSADSCASVAATTKSSATPASSKVTTSSEVFVAGSSLPPSYASSHDCVNTTGAEPHRMGTSAPVQSASETPSLVTVSSPPATSSSASTPFGTPSTCSTASTYSTSSAASPISSAASSSSATLSTSYVNSYDCNNITAAEPHRMGSSLAVDSMSSACSISSQSQAASSAQTTPFRPVTPEAKFQQTSTTTVVDATVTTIVPCPTDIGSQSQLAEQKRDLSYRVDSTDKLCDAGVYCVNSTFVSDAPPSWHWDDVGLKQGQTCLEDDVFNTDWIELQCACAGL